MNEERVKVKRRKSLSPELQWLKDTAGEKTDGAKAMQVENAGSDLAQLPGRANGLQINIQ
jgi:hypothetical protein